MNNCPIVIGVDKYSNSKPIKSQKSFQNYETDLRFRLTNSEFSTFEILVNLKI
jgi:hypothetical protein